LKRITAPVSQDLEITEIADRVTKVTSVMKGDPAKNVALFFENVRGHSIPVVIGLFGTEQRMAWALGVERLDDLNTKLSEFISMDMPRGLIEKAQRGLEMLNDLRHTEPRIVSRGACQEVIEEKPVLSSLPIIQCWPLDAGRYITLPSVFSRDPKTGKRNVGMYRLQVMDDQTLGMHWQRHKGGAEHQRVRALHRQVSIRPAVVVIARNAGADDQKHRRG
jgi:4-hydroxy-3-polyprenylbenzoate decarboxylase